MNTLQLRLLSAGLFFLLILPSGFWLSRSGKPYSFVLFNIHKLMGFGLFVFLANNVFRVNQTTPFSAQQLAACLIAAVSFVATIATGGLVSIPHQTAILVSLSHKLLPYLTVLATSMSIYLLLRPG